MQEVQKAKCPQILLWGGGGHRQVVQVKLDGDQTGKVLSDVLSCAEGAMRGLEEDSDTVRYALRGMAL